MILEMTATALLTLAAPTRASSETAQYVAAKSIEGRHRLRSSYSLGLGLPAAMDELLRVANEANAPNWDGYGAEPVTAHTYLHARSFLDALPFGIPAPSIGVEPDGQVTLEWHHSRRRTLSVSVTPEGDLHYAALLGPAKAYGTEPFLGEVPQTILGLIHRVKPKPSQTTLLAA